MPGAAHRCVPDPTRRPPLYGSPRRREHVGEPRRGAAGQRAVDHRRANPYFILQRRKGHSGDGGGGGGLAGKDLRVGAGSSAAPPAVLGCGHPRRRPVPRGLGRPPRFAAWKTSGVVIFRLNEVLLLSGDGALRVPGAP